MEGCHTLPPYKKGRRPEPPLLTCGAMRSPVRLWFWFTIRAVLAQQNCMPVAPLGPGALFAHLAEQPRLPERVQHGGIDDECGAAWLHG
jgi:hypothetical protein